MLNFPVRHDSAIPVLYCVLDDLLDTTEHEKVHVWEMLGKVVRLYHTRTRPIHETTLLFTSSVHSPLRCWGSSFNRKCLHRYRAVKVSRTGNRTHSAVSIFVPSSHPSPPVLITRASQDACPIERNLQSFHFDRPISVGSKLSVSVNNNTSVVSESQQCPCPKHLHRLSSCCCCPNHHFDAQSLLRTSRSSWYMIRSESPAADGRTIGKHPGHIHVARIRFDHKCHASQILANSNPRTLFRVPRSAARGRSALPLHQS